MAQIIKVTIDDNTGEMAVDLDGFHGKGCDAVIQAFADSTEQVTVNEKPEYKAVNKAVRTVQQKQ